MGRLAHEGRFQSTPPLPKKRGFWAIFAGFTPPELPLAGAKSFFNTDLLDFELFLRDLTGSETILSRIFSDIRFIRRAAQPLQGY